jgi:hypothetical protein
MKPWDEIPFVQKKAEDKWSLTTYFEIIDAQENNIHASTILAFDLILIGK